MPSKILINGNWVDSSTGETIPVLNPATLEVLAYCPKGNRDDAREAIDSAVSARSIAEEMTAYDRSKILLKVANLLEQNASTMALLISQNVGKPIVDAEFETARAALTLTF